MLFKVKVCHAVVFFQLCMCGIYIKSVLISISLYKRPTGRHYISKEISISSWKHLHGLLRYFCGNDFFLCGCVSLSRCRAPRGRDRGLFEEWGMEFSWCGPSVLYLCVYIVYLLIVYMCLCIQYVPLHCFFFFLSNMPSAVKRFLVAWLQKQLQIYSAEMG